LAKAKRGESNRKNSFRYEEKMIYDRVSKMRALNNSCFIH
jgi:hypothetical protein